MEHLLAALMGLVEGLTEFLPVSSTGHLILTQQLSGFAACVGTEFANTFTIVIQLGAILAVVVAYPARFAGLLRPARTTAGGSPSAGTPRFAGGRGLGLLLLTTLPALALGAWLDETIDAVLFHAVPVALALAAGAVWIVAAEWWLPRRDPGSIDNLTWRQALGVGCFQCLAMWPGMSRSASTILGGMTLGLDRRTATEYSFFAAVPVLAAAAGYKLLKHHQFEAAQLSLLAVGLVVSFVSALVAVRLFVRYLRQNTLVAFAWYRLALAAVVLCRPEWFQPR